MEMGEVIVDRIEDRNVRSSPHELHSDVILIVDQGAMKRTMALLNW
jgi:hypothetical protein